MKFKQYKVLKIHPADNVLVALQDLNKDEMIGFDNKNFQLVEPVAAKHKIFIHDMQEGEAIKMYGVTVGKIVVEKVSAGQRMTIDNTKHAAEPYKIRNMQYVWQPPDTLKFQNRTFDGYH